MIILYANAGSGVGFGHIFRLLPILGELKKNLIPVSMTIPLPEKTLYDLGMKFARSIEPGVESIISFLRNEKPSVFFFDSYEQPNKLIESISGKMCQVMCFDDHYQIEKPVHTIVNCSLDANLKKYNNISEYSLLGPHYFPLMDAFQDLREQIEIRPTIKKILVAMGGDDTGGCLDSLLKVLLAENIHKKIVGVCGNSMPAIVHPLLNKLGWLSQTELIQKLGQYDIAILAGGSMLQQCASIGLPVISWPQNQHQVNHAKCWEKNGSVICVNKASELKIALNEIENADIRKQMSQAGCRIVDGLGKNRIVTHLKRIIS